MGDAACHLAGTCLSCGLWIEENGTVTCPHCGAPRDAASSPLAGAQGVNTILYCDRWTETVAFYRTVLGLRERFANDWFVEFDVAPGATVSIADTARATIESSGGRGLTLSIRIADLDAAHNRLEGRHVDVVRSRRFGLEVLDIHDPEGNRIELWAG